MHAPSGLPQGLSPTSPTSPLIDVKVDAVHARRGPPSVQKPFGSEELLQRRPHKACWGREAARIPDVFILGSPAHHSCRGNSQGLVPDRPQARRLAVTGAGHEVRAARMEGAPRGPVIGMRHGAHDRRQALSRARSQARDGAQERSRIRMPGSVEDLVHWRLLDDAAQVHHASRRHLGDHARSWVRIRIACRLPAGAGASLENLLLGRHVCGRGRRDSRSIAGQRIAIFPLAQASP